MVDILQPKEKGSFHFKIGRVNKKLKDWLKRVKTKTERTEGLLSEKELIEEKLDKSIKDLKQEEVTLLEMLKEVQDEIDQVSKEKKLVFGDIKKLRLRKEKLLKDIEFVRNALNRELK